MKSVCIIGGGITGTVAALYLASKGCNVSIFEKQSRLGGILGDHIVDGNWFFKNCQYISPHESWTNLLAAEELQTFQHDYYSYTDLWGSPTISENFAFPVYPHPLRSLTLRRSAGCSLKDRVGTYPDEIARGIIAWLNQFKLPLNTLHGSAAIGLQIARVFPSKNRIEVLKYKSVEPLADEYYGVPRFMLTKEAVQAAIPRYGYSSLFETITHQLRSSGVLVTNGAAVIPARTFDRWAINGEHSFKGFHNIIWTANPTALLQRMSGYKLTSPSFEMMNHLYVCKEEINHEPFYIQVYSLQSPITRIFCYSNKVTVESLPTHDVKHVTDFCLHVLESLGKKVYVSLLRSGITERRHFAVSISDFNYINEFLSLPEFSEKPCLLCSPWHQYGRDAKINALLRAIDTNIL